MPEFIDDDAGYVAWVAEHPYGYVVTSWNPPRADYISLHRADCQCINPDKARHIDNWTQAYIKACGETIEELQNWAETRFGTGPHALAPCGHCRNAGRVGT